MTKLSAPELVLALFQRPSSMKAAEELNLAAGQAAYAVVKARYVMIGID